MKDSAIWVRENGGWGRAGSASEYVLKVESARLPDERLWVWRKRSRGWFPGFGLRSWPPRTCHHVTQQGRWGGAGGEDQTSAQGEHAGRRGVRRTARWPRQWGHGVHRSGAWERGAGRRHESAVVGRGWVQPPHPVGGAQGGVTGGGGDGSWLRASHCRELTKRRKWRRKRRGRGGRGGQSGHRAPGARSGGVLGSAGWRTALHPAGRGERELPGPSSEPCLPRCVALRTVVTEMSPLTNLVGLMNTFLGTRCCLRNASRRRTGRTRGASRREDTNWPRH